MPINGASQHGGQGGHGFSFKGSIVSLAFLCSAQTTITSVIILQSVLLRGSDTEQSDQSLVRDRLEKGKKKTPFPSAHEGHSPLLGADNCGLSGSNPTAICQHLSRACCTNYRSLRYRQFSSFKRLVGVAQSILYNTSQKKRGKMTITQSDRFCYYFINYYYHYHYYSSLDVTDIFAIFVVFFFYVRM